MSSNNALTEKHLDRLAEILCQTIIGEETHEPEKTDELLGSLVMSGYARDESNSLSKDLEERVKGRCLDVVRPRGAELSGLIQQMQKKYNDLKMWRTNHPEAETPPSAANISSATDK